MPLTINFAGYNHLQEPVNRANTFGVYPWIYCVDGEGELILHGQKYILNPGKLALIYAHEEHEYRAVSKEWQVNIIGFSGNNCGEILRTLRLHQSGIYHLKNEEIFYDCFNKILNIMNQRIEKEPVYRRKKQADRNSKDLTALSKICYEFLLDLSEAISPSADYMKATNNESLKMMIVYMEDHYQEVISLYDLAEYVNISRSYVSDIFKKEMNQTVVEYLNNYRIAMARIMLEENPEIKAAEIGKHCGFENPSYFSKVFKKIVGLTPIEYRQRR